MTDPIDDILKGVEEISQATRLSPTVTRKLLSIGMPGFQIDGQWYSSKKAIEKFFFLRALSSGRNRAKKL